ncbi:hypothetical protein [Streptomyces sp. NBC_00385]|uniref:hypothetical protein n=1 Tax=Streptomyces sp. NBC_00385 TaxID=2975733 RepID=UPI002DD8D955|nr:hypothetical protein [Streptomyces sp. NBC_00385]WRZ05073.1 hypothetical protein OG959_17800 [Streptomyces sp. NBC_00385]
MPFSITVPVHLTVDVLGDDLVGRNLGTIDLDITDGAISEDQLRGRLGELLIEAGRYLTTTREYPDPAGETPLTTGGTSVPIVT